jgi:hypothetical protein
VGSKEDEVKDLQPRIVPRNFDNTNYSFQVIYYIVTQWGESVFSPFFCTKYKELSFVAFLKKI